MLESLHIQNYRLFKDLKIDKLGQVNLIAGKNNTGKTALLEAIRIALAPLETTLNNIIYSRGDYYPNDQFIFESLFLNRNYKDNNIKIVSNYNGNLENHEMLYGYNKRKYGFYFKEPDDNLTEIDVLQLPQLMERNVDYVFLPLQSDENMVNELWKKISLTPLEDEVIGILKIIESRIDKVRVDDKKTKVLLENESQPLPLKNLGDGINRLFSIALSLVNCKKKTLLIDEFEVGLHHSVQKQLWEVIFKYAKEWNIQVFVTTHSHDTVKAFATVWNEKENIDKGNYFRLTQDKADPSVIYPEFYDHEELLSSIYNLEPR